MWRSVFFNSSCVRSPPGVWKAERHVPSVTVNVVIAAFMPLNLSATTLRLKFVFVFFFLAGKAVPLRWFQRELSREKRPRRCKISELDSPPPPPRFLCRNYIPAQRHNILIRLDLICNVAVPRETKTQAGKTWQDNKGLKICFCSVGQSISRRSASQAPTKRRLISRRRLKRLEAPSPWMVDS